MKHKFNCEQPNKNPAEMTLDDFRFWAFEKSHTEMLRLIDSGRHENLSDSAIMKTAVVYLTVALAETRNNLIDHLHTSAQPAIFIGKE